MKAPREGLSEFAFQIPLPSWWVIVLLGLGGLVLMMVQDRTSGESAARAFVQQLGYTPVAAVCAGSVCNVRVSAGILQVTCPTFGHCVLDQAFLEGRATP